ncbi:bifunctional 2-polyprenyl-6-hydroxyphenol methylase/3-demethylubiquinol 3-O-methyltransferase UbiG [Hyphobacterium sp. HN65]|uniref:Ubiquinone biosynthesis O-methyltransferase n=1 Tax=Hyphobacterium lacteum TaxID=3116575 RepID=A0ABU7LQ84_9PROT|nr:bifunctional 2-polyprenyl-6-hydroxyphenol methylase/3-demethylubiquinol 3-O-methyltransferase UbiG [Hyphobacterium sp. HN65]MEE2526075.1 bifunctional 2-polyprenyl-6-hydroxyphenol methylase/3-demethylubiquinol 3-O-methyltransferase UbiG [Hyphobacterium sp. HN65]
MAQADAPEKLSRPSVDPQEIEKFSRIAAEWWDPDSKFKPLHKFNPARLAYIRDAILTHYERAPGETPLTGLKLLDIGCGGGLIAEPMARLGASVTAVDAAEANIKTATVHAEEQGLEIDYRHGTAEQLLEEGDAQFDVVLNLEVVEHVANPDQFLKDCAKLLKPGGIMVVGSINRTSKAFVFAIFGAEWVMRWLPRGTHRFEKLIKPEEVRAALSSEGMSVREAEGVSYNPLQDAFEITGDASVNYLMVAVKA